MEFAEVDIGETAIPYPQVIVKRFQFRFSNSRSTVMESVVIETILANPINGGNNSEISPPANSLVGNLDLRGSHHIKIRSLPGLRRLPQKYCRRLMKETQFAHRPTHEIMSSTTDSTSLRALALVSALPPALIAVI